MSHFRKLCLAALACLAATSTGCVWSLGGGDTKKVVQSSQGAQLSDLKKARDEGAITEDEYQSMKRKILESSQ